MHSYSTNNENKLGTLDISLFLSGHLAYWWWSMDEHDNTVLFYLMKNENERSYEEYQLFATREVLSEKFT